MAGNERYQKDTTEETKKPISLRMNRGQKAFIKIAADEVNTNSSELIRTSALLEAKRIKQEKADKLSVSLEQLLTEELKKEGLEDEEVEDTIREIKKLK